MTDMRGDIVNRVRRLPKPSNQTEALQPLFEAVSNGMHAVEDRYEDRAVEQGQIVVTVTNLADPANVEIVVEDNGIGLDGRRFDAFTTTDTDCKIERGGKGVGRLLWLDCFSQISVDSVFLDDGELSNRTFSFRLSADDQIFDEQLARIHGRQPGTVVRFTGIRQQAYREKFPSYRRNLVKHFGSHFLANFIMGRAPRVELIIDGEATAFPDGVTEMLRHAHDPRDIETDEFGVLNLSCFTFDRAASSDFDGDHQLHFVAGGRTVMSRKIDGLLGIGKYGDDATNVFHACVEGEFLEERVNQERTHFNFDESTAEDIAKVCADDVRENALAPEIAEFDAVRLASMKDFLSEYPSFQYEAPEALLNATPKNATKPEQFARSLIVHRIRRDVDRRRRIQEVVATLNGEGDVPQDFAEAVREAANDVRAEEQRQLTEYVVKRKMVLDVLGVLIRRVRERADREPDHHLESTLHQFICPMRIRGDDPGRVEASDHELWIIDERLAFARYFASDVPFNQIIANADNAERPDVFVFDQLHGLGISGEEPLRRVMLIEFKRPGKTNYEDKYLPGNQITRYLAQLKSGRVENFDNERVRIADDCVFHCYIIADIAGSMEIHTSAWNKTSNGRGRWQPLAGDYRGSIEVIEWRDLVNDAKARSAAFIEQAGL